MTLEIHALPRLPNQLLGAHWGARCSEARRWRKLVGQKLLADELERRVAAPNAGPMPRLQRARIHCVRLSVRRCDADNLCASFKSPIDALVHHGIIVDDSPDHIVATYEWQRAARLEQRVVITVEAVE